MGMMDQVMESIGKKYGIDMAAVGKPTITNNEMVFEIDAAKLNKIISGGPAGSNVRAVIENNVIKVILQL